MKSPNWYIWNYSPDKIWYLSSVYWYLIRCTVTTLTWKTASLQKIYSSIKNVSQNYNTKLKLLWLNDWETTKNHRNLNTTIWVQRWAQHPVYTGRLNIQDSNDFKSEIWFEILKFENEPLWHDIQVVCGATLGPTKLVVPTLWPGYINSTLCNLWPDILVVSNAS